MTHQNAIFDSITNSEDEMIRLAGIDKKYACLYLRAYIITRLLFCREFVISDSSINLNRALRTLILRDEGAGIYDLSNLPPADFGQLIEDGSIKLAARDKYKGNFSDCLRIAQSNKKHVDLPSEKYTNLIDGICREENVYWWNAERISQLFTDNFREELTKDKFSEHINLFLRDILNRMSGEEILTYSMVKDDVLKRYNEKSDEYQITRMLLREAYDYNIPKDLRLDYFRHFNGSMQLVKNTNFDVNSVEEYKIPWKYSINMYAFALFPASYLSIAWGSGEYIRYEEAMLQYRKGEIGFDSYLASFEDYLELLDRMATPLYKIKYADNKPKNMIVNFQEYRNSTSRMPGMVKTTVNVYDAVNTVINIIENPLLGSLEFIGTTVLPNIVLKMNENQGALPEIEHAIVKKGASL